MPEKVKKLVVGVQMLFVAFGSLVLVPLLTGLDPCIALFTAGVGTLLFHLITKSQVPIFLASSFAFIAPIQYVMKTYGVSDTLGALVFTGFTYMIFGALVWKGGPKVIERYLPPIVTGPVIMVIGLKLAPVAVKMAKSFDASGTLDGTALSIAMITLLTAVCAVIYGKKVLSLIPVLTGIMVGYCVSMVLGVVDFSPVVKAAWFHIPWTEALRTGGYALPTFNPSAILFLMPVAIAPAVEHVGDILAIGSVTGKDYIVKPGLHRTLTGDGVATSVAGLLGGPPVTTYSEVTGAVALTRAFDPAYMKIAACAAVLIAFLGKLGAVLKTIPVPVMGGILILLFGMIAAIGVGCLVRARLDMSKSRNLVIASIILVLGIGDMQIGCGSFRMGGIGLAGVVGILLNLILPEGGKA